MILIATDEAGYGPKLGPLVVAATTWRLPGTPRTAAELSEAFETLSRPMTIDGLRIKIDDSKAVFQPKSAGQKGAVGYAKLERATLAGCRWCGLASDRLEIVKDLASADDDAIQAAPWLRSFHSQEIETEAGQGLVEHWNQGGARLVGIQTRVITAAAFNHACNTGMNKSDLLSQITLQLVRSALDHARVSPPEAVSVFCDRHGGRRYYAGPLHASFDGPLIQAIRESKTESSYNVPYQGSDFTIRFTVKGDSFTPVAFSSMVAKYLREKAMESLNDYFSKQHSSPDPLRPTAGYPVDADRFLVDIDSIIQREKIDLSSLIRSR